MEIKVANKIFIKEPTAEVIKWCKDNLILENPEYTKKLRMGKWLGNTPSKIWLFEKKGDILELPYGCLRYFTDTPISYQFSLLRHFNYENNIKLYEYQIKCLQKAIEGQNGILVMPCGSGKTILGLSIIAKLGGRALWLTHTQDLLTQSKKRAESIFNCDKNAYGTITGGKVNISNGITFATVQTMVNLDLSQYQDAFDIVIVDECQHTFGSPTRVSQFYKVLSNLSARYKYGLTATPKRNDGLEKSMYALIGPKLCEISKNDVSYTTCPVTVKIIETKYRPCIQNVTCYDGTIDYSALVDDIVSSDYRFSLLTHIFSKIPNNSPTIVLSNRVKYLNVLCKWYNDNCIGKSICLSALGNTKKAKKEREQALDDLNNEKLNCIFATYQLAKEGLDVPNLKYIIFATPEKDEVTITQSVGRVARKSTNKKFGIVIDLVDDFPMYKNWAKKRITYYKKLNCTII